MVQVDKAMNAIAAATMREWYPAHVFTHNHIYGFLREGNVHIVTLNTQEVLAMTKLSKSSKTGCKVLKVKAGEKIRKEWIAEGKTRIIATENELMELVDDGNRGHAFEKLIFKVFSLGAWKYNSIALDEGADAVIDGVPYSLKFEEATLITMDLIDSRNAEPV